MNLNTKNAYGVRFVNNKRYYNAYATKEVILCAGGLNSPQLLMLSGVGPKEHLQELGKVNKQQVISNNRNRKFLRYSHNIGYIYI